MRARARCSPSCGRDRGVRADRSTPPGRSSSPDPDRPVAVVFTSGTTGEPKGAVFTWRQLEAIGDIDGGGRWGDGGRGLSSTSFAHLGYMTKLPQALRGGGTTFIMGRWSAGDALEMVERHGITALGGIPTQVALMLRHDRFDATDTSSVRMIAMGGGPSTAALVREARATLRRPRGGPLHLHRGGCGCGDRGRRSPRGRRGERGTGPQGRRAHHPLRRRPNHCRRASSGMSVCVRRR